MPDSIPTWLPLEATRRLLQSLADDELMLGHRDSEWTGHAPILEEDIAFSNIAQDELGHALVWYTLLGGLTGKSPDQMAFGQPWNAFTCCRFVTYPRGDFGYTVVRQFLFDEAEQVRLEAFNKSSYEPLRTAAAKILREEAYHLIHTKGLVERLGDATEESHTRMQRALDLAFPQALGIFEELESEADLIETGIFPGNRMLLEQWLARVVPVLTSATLSAPATPVNGKFQVRCDPDLGGRQGSHSEHLRQLVEDLQMVYRSVPGGNW